MRTFNLIILLTASTISLSFTFSNSDKKQVEVGKQLFNKMCATCHKPSGSAIGPPFQKIREERGKAWVYQFMKNPAVATASDKQVKAQVKKYKIIMPAYKLTNTQVDAIMDYVDSFPYAPNSKDYEHRKIK